MFLVISVYFNIRNTLPKSGTFLLGHPVYKVQVIKSRRMRWARHVARMGAERGCIGSCWGNRRKGDHWGDIGIDGWIILGWISRRWDVGIWTGLGWPRIETVGGRL